MAYSPGSEAGTLSTRAGSPQNRTSPEGTHVYITRASSEDAEPLDAFVRGVVRARTLVGPEESDELRVQFARFDAGGRNVFHTHDFDQALLITDGEGVVATDEEEHRVTAGDFVLVPAGERHWHGAADSGPMSHLAFGVPGSSDFDGVAYGATE